MSEYTPDEMRLLIEKYNREFMNQYAPAVSSNDDSLPNVFPSASATIEEPSANNELTDIGRLQIRVSTENQAVPIPGATVTITHITDDRPLIDRLLITDSSGLTEIIELPTKDRQLSLSPQNIRPFETYNVDVSATGYFPKSFVNLPIYGGVTAIQNVSMIPLPEGGGGDIAIRKDLTNPL